MNIESTHKRGFCPRVWTPMESGDGLIVRVHPELGEIAAAKLEALIGLAERYGNGQIDITRRANLQLRGIAARELGALQEALVASGWASPNQAGERNFALLSSPLLGLDDESAPLFLLARKLERALVSDAAPSFIHPKLCIAIDDGERLLRDVPFDLQLAPVAHAPGRIRLAVSDAERRARLLGSCTSDDAVLLVMRMVDLLSEQVTRPLRMHEWAAATGLETLRAALSPKLVREDALLEREPEPPPLVGYQRRKRPFFGLLFPFGSGSAEQWRTALRLSRQFGSGALRATAQRALLLLDVPDNAQEELAARADAAGFVQSPDDPLLHVSACTGAPLCSAAHGETRDLARALAVSARPLLRQGVRLHVSGCAKSCAYSGASALTFVHDPDGMHFGRDQEAADALHMPVIGLEEAHSALRSRAHEYATCSRAERPSDPVRSVEPDSEQPE